MSVDRLRFVLHTLVLLIGTSAGLHSQDRTSLAIIDFDAFGVSEQEASVLTIRLGSYLVQSGVFRVIERGQMRQILEEQDFQMTGCTSDECAVEIGQLLGAEMILAGSFGKIGSTYTIDMRVIDVETGGILETASYDIRGEIDQVLTEGMAEAARRLAGLFGGDMSAEPAAPAPESAAAMAILEVRSQPAGAEVMIDGQPMETTPLERVELAPNQEHSIAINLAGYYAVDTTLYAEAGQRYRLSIPLERLRSWLTIDGDAGARISIDGAYVGQLPLDRQRQIVGQHEFKATKPEFFPYTTQFVVNSSQEAAVSFRLQRKPKRPAILMSVVLPGSGQLYQGYRGKGLLFLIGTAATGFLAYDSYSRFVEDRDLYEQKRREYRNAQEADEIQRLRGEMQERFDAMELSRQSQLLTTGLLGAVWVINLIEITFLGGGGMRYRLTF
ncbi:MAG: PEGA domain-containing protein, partial [Fidelibacterota bacterium]